MARDVEIIKYVPNFAGFKAMRSTPEMEHMLLDRAQKASEAAVQQFEKDGPHPYETGAYVDSIQYEAATDSKGSYGVVFSDVDHAPYLEYGTGIPTPAFASLRLGALASGLALKGGGALHASSFAFAL